MTKFNQEKEMGLLLNPEERNSIKSLFRPPLHLIDMAVVRVFEFHYGGNSVDWEENEFCSGGVLVLVYNEKTKYYSFKVVDPETMEIVFVFFVYQSFSYDEESEYFHSFEGKNVRIGFLFSSVVQAKNFLKTVKNCLYSQESFESEEAREEKIKRSSRRYSLRSEVMSKVVRRFGSFLKNEAPKHHFEISDPSNFRQETHIGHEIFLKKTKHLEFRDSVDALEEIQKQSNETEDSKNQIQYALILPNELASYIFSFLVDPADLCAVSQTCIRWNMLANGDQLWKALYCRLFGEEKFALAQAANTNRRKKQMSWKQLFIEQYSIKLSLRGSVQEVNNLRKASVEGDLKALKRIAKRYELNYPLDSDGYTCLHYTSIHGHSELVKFILETGNIPINSRVDEIYRYGSHAGGDTALHMACQHGKFEVVKILVEYGADINIVGEDRRTPLHKAAMRGHLDIVIYLVENGASVNVMDRVGRHTPCDLARTFNRTEVIKYLKTCTPDLEDLN